MADYRLIDGFVVPHEVEPEEQLAILWEAVLEQPGRHRLSDETNANLSFKCPESNARIIECAAKVSGLGKSAFIRDAVMEKAARVLSLRQDEKPLAV